LWTIESFGRVQGSPEGIKKALIDHGPLSVISSNWGHAFVLVGYDDNCTICINKYGRNGCWIIRNSWGVLNGWQKSINGSYVWYENGYGYIPYTGFPYSDLIDLAYYVEGVKAP
jgi:C1A family cysteine protease